MQTTVQTKNYKLQQKYKNVEKQNLNGYQIYIYDISL